MKVILTDKEAEDYVRWKDRIHEQKERIVWDDNDVWLNRLTLFSITILMIMLLIFIK